MGWICVSTRISLSGASACVFDFIERGFCTWRVIGSGLVLGFCTWLG